MKPFLRQVAEHYSSAGNIDRTCFIFPNRRSLVFFTRYLAECLKGSSKPVFTPKMFTMNDFFFRVSGKRATDKVNLLLCLYDCYKSLYPKAESLDEFIFWGDVLLSDFDDVDKYLVNPRDLFANVSDFKSIQDTYSYLTDTQRTAIENFLRHFREDGRLTVDIGSVNPDVKGRFLQIWDILYPLYTRFNEALSARGDAYEGQAYRELADRIAEESASDVLSEVFPEQDTFVFVGLNALNECEKKVMRRMRDAGLAQFCWDYSSKMIRDRRNKSSFFMSSNVTEFPQAADWDCGETSALPEINVLSVPSSTGQAKQLPGILSGIGEVGIDTAIVLPDENLLIPVLNSIPEQVRDINVTMGYPMGGSEFYSLLNDICTMQLHLRQKDGEWYFYHRQVWAIFSNSIFKVAAGEEGRQRMAAVKSGAKYYIPEADLRGIPVFDLVFKAVAADARIADASVIHALEDYQSAVIRGLALSLRDDPDMAIELEFAKEYYLAVNRLRRIDLPVLPATYFRLLVQIVGTASVPFKGEPLKGLQIMGPLETRALDFDNLIILSCNEGVFPRRSVSSSFIPPELRKGFGLPTYEYQDAVWAYYFYRMIQRASRIWMLYDSRTENMKSGEESRYIKQLELHFGAGLRRCIAKSVISETEEPGDIAKTEADVETVRESSLSASALQNYLSCPAKFYYHTVKKLRPDDEVAESLDAGMIGNVFHATMEDIYSGRDTVTAGYVRDRMKDRKGIAAIIRGHVKEELNTIEVSGRNLIFEEVVLQYVLKVLSRDLEHMKACGVDCFSVLGLELTLPWEFHGFRFKGIIDRLDSFLPGTVRVVDYKTGKVEDADIHINDSNASEVVEKLFGQDNSKRPKIALQLFLYDRFVRSLSRFGDCDLVNSIYQTSGLFVNPVEDVPVSEAFCALTEERLAAMLDEIADVRIPFRRTDDPDTCKWCDFKMLCGR
ncbi:MAG: PD-(D/E)XK nuclease family protein [Bacteroidales bacterium]|nr:PD-(D/E)XK nuclease family protein [Candidatus Cryptobacteroides onthequi]